MRGSALILAALLFPASARAACESPTSARDLSEATNRFYGAWHDLDDVAVAQAMGEADAALACIDEPLAAPDVVAYFQIRGLAAFLGEDKTAARDAFRAALSVLPDYALPSTAASAGDPWYEMYEALRSMPDDGRVELAAPTFGWIQVDGTRAHEHPSARPWLFQQFDASGGVVQTAVVWTRQKPPVYAEVGPAPEPEPTVPVVTTHPSRGLAIAGGLASVAGVASLGGAAALRARYNSPDSPPQTADRLIGPNVGLGVLGYAALATGAGLGTSAVVVGRW